VTATTPEWLTAAATMVLGVLGLLVGLWQFWAQGFRPKVRTTVEPHRRRVMVEIHNKGRSQGLVLDIALQDKRGYELPAIAHGFYRGVYRPTFLPGNTEMRVRLDSATPLPDGVRVRVVAGGKEPVLLPRQADSVFIGEPTVLPPNP
jgi:hypothetical protein